MTTDSGSGSPLLPTANAGHGAERCNFPRATPRSRLNSGTAYSQEARVWNTRGGLREAAELFRRAVALREGALERNPSDVLTRRSLMITYGNLGGTLGNPLYPNLGDTAGAREYYGKALAIARDLAKADRNDQLAQYDLANALLYRSCMDLPKEEWAESLANLQEADGILQKLCAADPGSIANLRTLAMVEEYEGRRLEGLGRGDEAIVKARQVSCRCGEGAGPHPYRPWLGLTSIGQRGGNGRDSGSPGRPDRSARYGAQSHRPGGTCLRSESERDRVTRSRAMAYQNLANVEAIFGNWSEARVAAQRAVDGWRADDRVGKSACRPRQVGPRRSPAERLRRTLTIKIFPLAQIPPCFFALIDKDTI